MNHDPLTDQLVADLKPVKPLSLKALAVGLGLGLGLAVIYIAVIMGLRPEIKALMHGQWPLVSMVVLKPLLFLSLGILSTLSMGALSRPEGALSWPITGGFILLGLLLGLGLWGEIETQGLSEISQRLHDPIFNCFATILTGGALGYGALWYLWLRKTATSQPWLMGGLSGLMSASFMAAAYALHCDRDAPIYILTYYGAATFGFALICAVLGPRLLKW